MDASFDQIIVFDPLVSISLEIEPMLSLLITGLVVLVLWIVMTHSKKDIGHITPHKWQTY